MYRVMLLDPLSCIELAVQQGFMVQAKDGTFSFSNDNATRSSQGCCESNNVQDKNGQKQKRTEQS